MNNVSKHIVLAVVASTLQKIAVDFTVKLLATSCQSISRFFTGARKHFQESGTVR